MPLMFTMVLHAKPTAYNRAGETLPVASKAERAMIKQCEEQALVELRRLDTESDIIVIDEEAPAYTSGGPRTRQVAPV